MTLRKTLTIISLALISTVLTACGGGGTNETTKVECSRPQDAFHQFCLNANSPAAENNRLRQCLDNPEANPFCAALIGVDAEDIFINVGGENTVYADLPKTADGIPSSVGHEDVFLNLPAASGATYEISTGDGYSLVTAGDTLYAVLLPNINLGAPFPTTTPDAIWTGEYNMPNVSDDGTTADEMDIDFTIDFGARTMVGTANTVTSANLTITTSFNEYGAITGGFRVNKLAGDGRTDDSITGKVVGLIGTQGTVGIFQGEDNATSYAGGFWATP